MAIVRTRKTFNIYDVHNFKVNGKKEMGMENGMRKKFKRKKK